MLLIFLLFVSLVTFFLFPIFVDLSVSHMCFSVPDFFNDYVSSFPSQVRVRGGEYFYIFLFFATDPAGPMMYTDQIW